MLAVRALDGLGFSKILTAGTYFLKKYRRDLNDLNVFPVPDGDTGNNLYLTARAAMLAAARVRDRSLSAVAAEAAQAALLGARGNSGVIAAQMLRGFAQAVRGRTEIATTELAPALQRAVDESRTALVTPVEGTIVSVAAAAAWEAAACAQHESDFYRAGEAIVRAANSALERTPDQLAVLREAGVVDAGGAGLVYFLEAILRFGRSPKERVTAYPRQANRMRTFSVQQDVSTNKFCTEFVLTETAIGSQHLRDHLIAHGDSLLVAGEPPMLRVHIHTDVPHVVQSIAGAHGTIDRLKIDDMQRQHDVLLAERSKRAFSFLAIVPGAGFDRLARELGAEETIVAGADEVTAGEIVREIDRCLGDVVVVLPSDARELRAAQNAAASSGKHVIVATTTDVASALAILVENGGRTESGPIPSLEDLEQTAARVRTATVALAGDASLERALGDAAVRLGADTGGLLTLYYGGTQREREVERIAQALRERLPKVEIEWFFGGQRTSEYVVAFER
jgi:DAK2 domain fusion protein YloV